MMTVLRQQLENKPKQHQQADCILELQHRSLLLKATLEVPRIPVLGRCLHAAMINSASLRLHPAVQQA